MYSVIFHINEKVRNSICQGCFKRKVCYSLVGLGPVLDLMAGPVLDLMTGPVLDLMAGPVLDLIAGPDFDLIPDFDDSGLDMTNDFKVSFTILVKNTGLTKS